MKHCNKCGTKKPLGSFGKDKTTTDGASCYCKPCKNEVIAKVRRTQKGVITRIYTSQRHASVKRGHPKPNYTKEELTKWLYANGYLALYDAWVDSGYDRWAKPSCDRLDDTKGYSFDNIQLLTWRGNLRKATVQRTQGVGPYAGQCKAVTRISSCGERTHYATIQQAADANSANRGNIGLCCNDHRGTADGYRWEFTKTIQE